MCNLLAKVGAENCGGIWAWGLGLGPILNIMQRAANVVVLLAKCA